MWHTIIYTWAFYSFKVKQILKIKSEYNKKSSNENINVKSYKTELKRINDYANKMFFLITEMIPCVNKLLC